MCLVNVLVAGSLQLATASYIGSSSISVTHFLSHCVVVL
jgi:hypothetical protein